MFRKLANKVALAIGLVGASVSSVTAAVPTEIADMAVDATTTWDASKTLIVAVVAFMILISYVKLLKKR